MISTSCVSNCTRHILQPLDVVVFKSFKAKLARHAKLSLRSTNAHPLPQELQEVYSVATHAPSDVSSSESSETKGVSPESITSDAFSDILALPKPKLNAPKQKGRPGLTTHTTCISNNSFFRYWKRKKRRRQWNNKKVRDKGKEQKDNLKQGKSTKKN